MKAQITRNKIIFPKLFLANYARTSTRSSLQYFIGLNSKTVTIYSVDKSVKLLLVLSIHTCHWTNRISYLIIVMKSHVVCSVDPDQLASEGSVYIWFHTVFKRVETCILFKHREGLAKFFVHYLFFWTSKTLFGQVPNGNLLEPWQISTLTISNGYLQHILVVK